MSNYARAIPYLAPQVSGGGSPPIDPSPKDGSCTLASGTTYYYQAGADGAPLESFSFRWDSAIIVTLTFEDTNFLAAATPNADATAGYWIKEDPSTAYIPGTGTMGLTVTNMTLAIAGGTAGGTTVNVGNLGSRRLRIKAVVAGTGGVLQVAANAKA